MVYTLKSENYWSFIQLAVVEIHLHGNMVDEMVVVWVLRSNRTQLIPFEIGEHDWHIHRISHSVLLAVDLSAGHDR